MQTIDVFGDRAVCCTKNADLIPPQPCSQPPRQYLHRGRVVPHFGEDGHPTSLVVVPAMSLIPLWSHGRGLAIDVVTCPFAVSNLSRANPCEHYAVQFKKHAYYDADFKGT